MLLYDIFSKKWLTGKGTIWIISDPHFGDTECWNFRFPYGCDDDCGDCEHCHGTMNNCPKHPLEIKEADKELIRRINSKCGKNDTLIILGDVGDIECVKKLKARYKILIMGNHDKGASNYKRVITYKLLPQELKRGDSQMMISMPKIEDNHLFDEVYEGPLMINDRIILSHEPIMGYGNYLFNIHGHVHNKNYQGDQTHLNCCAEAINYTPINLLSLIKKGLLKDIDNIHRQTIDKATREAERKKKNLKELIKL